MRRTSFIRKTLFVCAACLFAAVPGFAQIGEYQEVQRDTLEKTTTSTMTTVSDSITNPYRVVSNRFKENWFLTASGGIHSFRGDYSRFGEFKGTLSPEVSAGFGKWFVPWLAVKSEFIYSASRGYTGVEDESQMKTDPYGYGEWIPISGVDHLNWYRPMKIGPWWDVSLSTVLNLSRLIRGYEGNNEKKNMNQWLFGVGFGATHKGKQDNAISAHLELQYSRFFTTSKRVSLDLKFRGLFYQGDFDREYGQGNFKAKPLDYNLGFHAGLTYYFGKGYTNWNKGSQTVYRDNFTEREIQVMRERERIVEREKEGAVVVVEREKPVKRGALTFYVFYPNNYSGRNDAPLNAAAEVNAIDYLAGGIFTQKQYADSDKVAARLQEGRALSGLQVVDLPTEKADRDFAVDFVPRGYEIEAGRPISLSLASADIKDFGEKAGYYYAPIFDGQHAWKYRIDDTALGQHLTNEANYGETDSYGLNARAGLKAIRENLTLDAGDELVSFADVYAALNPGGGYISQYVDTATVAEIRHILESGVIMLIQVEGRATNQGNFSDASRAEKHNAELAENRASTVITWLTGFDQMKNVKSQTYLLNSRDAVRKVNDPSTRGLNAKLNRCVKVRIHYMIQE